MLKNNIIFKNVFDINTELSQALQEGRSVNVDLYKKEIDSILNMDEDQQKEKIFISIYNKIQELPTQDGYDFFEPSDLIGIKKTRPTPTITIEETNFSDDEYFDRIYGAWLGRCAGCLLGIPFEDWDRERMNGFLKEINNYPIKKYISSQINVDLKRKYNVVDIGTGRYWINNIRCMPEDDDTNYTVLGLNLLETYGAEFTTYDVAECWLDRLPINRTFTAERIAYRNLIAGIFPPQSAYYCNPYREWIGAQIRGDFFGYITPGKPELASEFAWRDASLSHTKNGIYGEMFVAAMISAAYITNSIKEIIMVGLSQIPKKCRLAENIRMVVKWNESGVSWERAIENIHSMYNEKVGHDRIHVISNAMIVCIALLYGEMDFNKSLSIATLGGMDTDCNGATVGSILGLKWGAKALPREWIEPLNDELVARVDDLGVVKISDLARRTMKIMRSIS